MIGTETLDRVIGKDVYDESGDKIGAASEVYLDDATGQPEWITVRTGLFGTKESFVPIHDADLTDDGVRVPVSKATVKDAPKIDADGHLSPQEEDELYRYYGMGAGTAGTDLRDDAGTAGTDLHDDAGTAGTDLRDDAGTRTRTDAGIDTHMADDARGTTGRDTTGRDTTGRDAPDDAMTRSEERLDVGTRREEVGRARLRKYVVTENVTQTVPVSREEVRVEREPITDADRGAALDGPAISEEEHEVTLHAERPVVEKEAVPVERVRLDRETVTDEARISEDVRKEQIDTDGTDAGRRI
ncbi:PRC and DUF2382 domain-containing protein [Geodermatophilus sp. YIM 151500]|uniref:PRC and DUF2382 domain-containing protein n=1 Tax=Geodermatophilus sp. YIM 151500 TaxID=2984531 RepID=UPI0021E3CB11|nr:PRC and DUF2382 domain-containing protein [Geodermatophilus sp. YIM 151500]MCV2490094.1 PRC and DUF2382 domain-containing protein [Geodermatophilus sp. YIM 151500]